MTQDTALRGIYSFQTGEQRFVFKNPELKNSLLELHIDSGRLTLAAIAETDLPAIFREFTPEIAKFMTPQPANTPIDTLKFIRGAVAGLQAGSDLQLVVFQKQTKEFLGCIGAHTRFGAMTPELGIWLKKSAHGCGYGLEATRVLKGWLESNLKVEHFYWPVAVENGASRRIPEFFGGTVVDSYLASRSWAPPLEIVVYQMPALH